jgi:hypothetical protein
MYRSSPTYRLKSLREDCTPGKHQGSKSIPFGLHTCEAATGADIGSGHNLLVAEICTRWNKIIRFQKGTARWNLVQFYAQRQKEQDTPEETFGAVDCERENVGGLWSDIGKCVLVTVSDWIGKVERTAGKPRITGEMMGKMDELGKWKNVNNEEGRKEELQKTEE